MKHQTETKTIVAYHFVVRAHMGLRPFQERRYSQRIWTRLQKSVPHCLAAVMMPNHLHLIVWNRPGTAESTHRLLRHLFDTRRWDPVPEPRPIADLHKLARQIRYVHLNPCRKRLCADPLQWEWSTHSEYVGAVPQRWANTDQVLHALGYGSTAAGLARFHRYITSDPTVHVSGTSMPRSLRVPPYINLHDVEKAAELALRKPRGVFQRKGRYRRALSWLLYQHMGIQQHKVAAHFGVTPSALRKTPALPSEHWKEALLKIIGDDRLMAAASRENMPYGSGS